MPEYHRGKARSPYRKRHVNVAFGHTTTGVKAQVILAGPLTGIIESKSWRGSLQIKGQVGLNTAASNGWVGFYRGQLSVADLQAIPSATLLAQSEVFGARQWVLGVNDHLFEMELIGITLSLGEWLIAVSACTFETGNTDVRIAGGFLFAEKEIPA